MSHLYLTFDTSARSVNHGAEASTNVEKLLANYNADYEETVKPEVAVLCRRDSEGEPKLSYCTNLSCSGHTVECVGGPPGKKASDAGRGGGTSVESTVCEGVMAIGSDTGPELP